jgi:hypothetical protein
VHLSLVVLRACPPEGPVGPVLDSGYRAASGQLTGAEHLTAPLKPVQRRPCQSWIDSLEHQSEYAGRRGSG